MNILDFSSPTITQSILVIALTIAIGLLCSEKLVIKKFSLGVTWILFVGIVLSHFGVRLESHVANFAKDFGLILFVYSIGIQVGPSFFSSFGKGGLKLNMLAMSIVLLAAVSTFLIHLLTGEDIATMVGVMSGAVTNTPSLGAAEQAFTDAFGDIENSIAAGYAVAYPLGVIGIIFSMLLIKWIFRINQKDEEKRLLNTADNDKEPVCIDIRLNNQKVDGITIQELHHTLPIQMVVSRVIKTDGTEQVPTATTKIFDTDILRILTDKKHLDTIALLGEVIEKPAQKETQKNSLISRRIVVTKPQWNGTTIRHLNVNDKYRITITRVNRAGVDLLPSSDLRLQLGDRLMVVGDKDDIEKVADMFGNELKKLDNPNLFVIFFGIVLGVLVGILPIKLPGLTLPFKLGLAGGSLIVAILLGRFGPFYHMITFSTASANRMLREIGICLFMATVGLDAGSNFVNTLLQGGYWWVLYGVIITLMPLLIVGFVGRKWLKLNYFTLMGLIAGSTTDPPALAYASSQSTENDQASVAYATVYPLTMFLRVMVAQLMILMLC